jgi:hypothetical protein
MLIITHVKKGLFNNTVNCVAQKKGRYTRQVQPNGGYETVAVEPDNVYTLKVPKRHKLSPGSMVDLEFAALCSKKNNLIKFY